MCVAVSGFEEDAVDKFTVAFEHSRIRELLPKVLLKAKEQKSVHERNLVTL